MSAIAAIRDALGHLRQHYRRMRDFPVEAGLAVDAPVDAIRPELGDTFYKQNALLPLRAVDRVLHQAVLSLNNAMLTNRGRFHVMPLVAGRSYQWWLKAAVMQGIYLASTDECVKSLKA